MSLPIPVLVVLTVFAAIGMASVVFLGLLAYSGWQEIESRRA